MFQYRNSFLVVITLKTDLQHQWRNKHIEKGYGKFIYDGIVDLEEWAKSSKKVCFFLKEAYLKSDSEYGDLCEWLKDGNVKRMWHTVSDWVFALNKIEVSLIPSYNEIDDNESERIKTISVVNIKKSEGYSNSKNDNLISFVEEDARFIKQQIEDIAPKIIVCGNTTYFFQIAVGNEFKGFEINYDQLNLKGFFWAGDTLIIDFCHPANRFDRMGKYYAFAALYQQALKEKGRL